MKSETRVLAFPAPRSPSQRAARICFRILRPLHFPVRGDSGEYLAVVAGSENLRVVDRTANHVVRRGSFPEDVLGPALTELEAAGALRFVYDETSVLI